MCKSRIKRQKERTRAFPKPIVNEQVSVQTAKSTSAMEKGYNVASRGFHNTKTLVVERKESMLAFA